MSSNYDELKIKEAILIYLYEKSEDRLNNLRLTNDNYGSEFKKLKEEKIYVTSYINSVLSSGVTGRVWFKYFPKCIHPPVSKVLGIYKTNSIISAKETIALEKINKDNEKIIAFIKQRVTFNLLI